MKQITKLEEIVPTGAYQDPFHPRYSQLRSDMCAWVDIYWDPMPEAMRADFLNCLMRSGANTNPNHPKHAQLMTEVRNFLWRLQWLQRTEHVLDVCPDPETADITDLLTSYANLNPKHPLHQATRARIDELYAALPAA